jgi:hypothetical protein
MVLRVEHLARALSKEFGWQPNEGTEWDKVVGIFALNTVSANLSTRWTRCMNEVYADILPRSIP